MCQSLIYVRNASVFAVVRCIGQTWWKCLRMTIGSDKGHFLLVYGSQTGQAKAIAEEFQQTTSDKGLSPALYCFSQFEKKVSFNNIVMVFNLQLKTLNHPMRD